MTFTKKFSPEKVLLGEISISEMNPAGVSNLTDLTEIAQSDGMGGYITFSVSEQDRLNLFGPLLLAPAGQTSVAPIIDSGASAVSDAILIYSGNTGNPGGVITVACGLTVDVDGSGDLVSLRIPVPPDLPANFTQYIQAQPLGFQAIISDDINTPGALCESWFHFLEASPVDGNLIKLTFEVAQVSQTYTVNSSWIYVIQSLSARKEFLKELTLDEKEFLRKLSLTRMRKRHA